MLMIRKYLTLNPRATHKDLFSALQPRIFHYYETIKRNYMNENNGQFDILKV
jgi:hypothetical protein